MDGAIIVTTPQDIALMDAVKGVEMFNKVRVPVLGIVENMAMYICSECGHKEHIFGAGGGEMMAKKYEVDVLGSLPLDMRIRQDLDDGIPTLIKAADGEIAKLYRDIAKKVASKLSESAEAPKMPEINIAD